MEIVVRLLNSFPDVATVDERHQGLMMAEPGGLNTNRCP